MRRTGGFTLIELMVTVAIVAILAAVALPAYSTYVQRGKITEAHSSLSELRLRAEKWFADNRTYVGFNQAITTARYFSYNCNEASDPLSATAFKCFARGIGDMGGFVFAIDQSNVRSSTFTALPGWNNSSTCWVTKKGETC